MDNNQIIQKIVEALQSNPEFEFPLDDFEKSFRDMGFNSLQYIQMLVLFEGLFDIEFENEYLNMDTLYNFNKVVECIKDKVN